MKIFKVPAVHSNGTGKTSLQDELAEAFNAVDEAKTKLNNCTTHMRDFYILPDGEAAFKIYRQQMRERMDRLELIKHELVSIYRAIEENKTETELV